jgi:hypothetical protein
MLIVVFLNVIMLNVIMLIVIMLSNIMLSVILLSVVLPANKVSKLPNILSAEDCVGQNVIRPTGFGPNDADPHKN